MRKAMGPLRQPPAHSAPKLLGTFDQRLVPPAPLHVGAVTFRKVQGGREWAGPDPGRESAPAPARPSTSSVSQAMAILEPGLADTAWTAAGGVNRKGRHVAVIPPFTPPSPSSIGQSRA